jgi:hypothetical protein
MVSAVFTQEIVTVFERVKDIEFGNAARRATDVVLVFIRADEYGYAIAFDEARGNDADYAVMPAGMDDNQNAITYPDVVYSPARTESLWLEPHAYLE